MKTISKTDMLSIGWVATVFMFVLGAFAFANAQTVSVTQQMSPGDSGDQVSALQTFLAADTSIYPEGLVTGFYGDLTTAAVQRYQCKNGIVCSGDAATTGYGRVGPSTLAKIETQLGTTPGGGVSLPPTGYPNTGSDVNAPIIGTPTVATTASSAVVSWTASEPSANRVLYGTTWPFLYAAAPSVTSASGFSQSAGVTIPGLLPNTTYYYVLESVDAAGNLQWSINHSLRTNP